MARIGRALVEEYCAAPTPAFPQAPGERLGAILNSAKPERREEVLGALEAEDRDFAAAVRKAIFTFVHLPTRLKPADVPRVLRGVANPSVALAIAAAQRGKPDEVATAEFLLSSLPQRLADTIREEMAGLGRIKAPQAEAAQAEIVARIREQVAAREIELIDPEGEEG